MDMKNLMLDLGMLCRCCDHSYKLPELEGLSVGEREFIENLCKLCAESHGLSAVNG